MYLLKAADDSGYYGIDMSTGGYPWLASLMQQAYFFKTEEEAREGLRDAVKYRQMLNNKDFNIYKIQLTKV